MKERVELYEKVLSPGNPILINIEAFDIDDEIPEKVEIRHMVRGIGNGRDG